MFENCKYKWEYQATKEKQDAYEDLIKKLNLPQPQDFISLPLEQKKNIINNFITQIRKINVFPVFYFNKDGIEKEILSVINKNDISFNKNDDLEIHANQGSILLDFLFPNLHQIHAGQRSNDSIYEIFYNDEKLFKCLLYSLQKQKIYTLRTAFFSPGRFLWNAGTNFLPMRAKAIYERFCPKEGVIYDYSAGYGGRMLGALSSKNNYKYIAVEPNSDTYYNLLQLGQLIESITNRKDSFQIYKQGSENFIPKEKVDLAFSCPPFFSLQTYSDEQTQSIVKFPKYNDWLQFYVKPTIENCFVSLKDDGIFAVDLMNCTKGKQKYYLIEDWLKIAQSVGFIFREVCNNNTKNRKKLEADREKILVFSKQINTKIFLPDINQDLIDKYNKRLQEVEIEKNKTLKTFCYYDVFGNLLGSFSSLLTLQKQCGYSKDIIQKYLNKKKYNEFYFKVYSKDEPILNTIQIKPIVCKINNIYFDSYAQAGRYLEVSRQAVQQAKQRKSKKIKDHQIIWY